MGTNPGAPPLEGVIPALVTPLGAGGDVDHAGLERLLAHVCAHRLGGIAPVGSTGEGPLLSRRQRVEVVTAVRAQLGAGLPVIAGAVSTSLEDLRGDLEAYAAAGASAVLVSPPFYYRHGPLDVERLLELLVPASPLPLVLYNIPQLTKVPVPPSVVARFAPEPCVIGIKDSSGDLEYLSTLLASLPPGTPFSVLTGTDTLLVASVLLGAAGTIAASVNLVPQLATGITAHLAAGEADEARSLQRRLLAVVQAVRRVGTPAGWKAALHLAGICGAGTAPPAAPPDATATAALAAELAALGVLPAAPRD